MQARERNRVWARNLTSVKHWCLPNDLTGYWLNQQPMNERLAPCYDPMSQIDLIQLSYMSLRDFFKTTYIVPATVQQQISKISMGILWNMHHVAITSFPVIWVVYYNSSTFPSKFSCCISWSLFPIPMKAQGCDSCSVQPSRSICSFFFFHPLPIRYTHGGGQKNLKMKNTLWDYIHLSWKFLRKKLLCTQSFLSLSHFAFSLYMHILHLPWRFPKMHIKKKSEKGKLALDALLLSIFPVQYMIGNSLHLYKTKILSTLTQKRFSKKVKRPWKQWQCFASVGAWYDAAINTHKTVLQTNLMDDYNS